LPPIDSHIRLKEEAKTLHARIETLIKDTAAETRMVRTLCVYAGMLTETLLEYEEPDVVMEQSFHRICDLLGEEPQDEGEGDALLPLAYQIDHDTELGRALSRNAGGVLDNGLDDVHEVVIALIINAIPDWHKQGYATERLLRLLIEVVIIALTLEMATQDFCDFIIEDYMAEDGHSTTDAITGMGIVAGYYFRRAQLDKPLPPTAEKDFGNVMVREALRHETPGTKNWMGLSAANDTESKKIPEYLSDIKPAVEEFFTLIGLEDPLAQAVSIAKAVGRMVAVISVEDVGQIHPSIAKSLARTGMILGMQYQDPVIALVPAT
jgi:hypothetical protein